ncbi:hypothetical protein PAXRUDRAFT_7984 [Paxillus rubicundulus Ve08.2h10]|uniref:SET domain-containing protein n=1 Tax=Paxillus rubicundulus Ve08.2h10 TaxID=930991 RepID=A0A0D0EDA3_9AGAM|nr:hypothetical protein PAXRUDRAFT_7984 [Paxillus rubicundulus Ve08.2h10]
MYNLRAGRIFDNPGQKDDPSANRRLEEAEVYGVGSSPRLHGASLSGFCHAYSLVSTRAFSVDAYHGLAMVPIADVFNHTNDNHLHMESDYDVCVECGSLAECEHDREVASHITPHPLAPNIHPLSQINASYSNENDYLEMRTVRPVPLHAELFNTYGTLPNATLLVRYGFTLPENEHDTVKMVFDPLASVENMLMYVARNDPLADADAGHGAVMQNMDIGHLAVRNRLSEGASAVTGPYNNQQRTRGRGIGGGDLLMPSSSVCDDKTPENLPICNNESTDISLKDVAKRLLRVFAYMSRVWSAEAAWDEHDDGLVFNPESGRPVTFLLANGPTQVNHDLVINSDGKISHNLWLLCTLIALFSTPSHLDPTFFGVVENGCESITALTEFKERLVHIQRYIERLRHDRESIGDDMDDSNHGSPSLSHPASSLPNMNYDPESDEFAQPTTALQLQPRPSLDPRDTFTCLPITATHGSRKPPVASQPKSVLGTGPQDLGINSTSFSLPASQALSGLFQIPAILPPPQVHATGHSHQETPETVTAIHRPKATVSSSRRNHSCSAERERPRKRFRHFSDDSVVVTQGGSGSNKLSRVTVEGASGRHLLDAPEGDAGIADHHSTALLLARVVVGLCYGRYRPPTVWSDQRGMGMTGAELGDLFDETPVSMPRTRSALLLAMSERSIVESCAASWGAILEK